MTPGPEEFFRLLSLPDCGRNRPSACNACVADGDVFRWAMDHVSYFEMDKRGDIVLSLSLDGCAVEDLP